MNADRLGERLVALTLAALGGMMLVQTGAIEGGAGFSGVGPRAFPYTVGAALVALAVLLARESLTGGFRAVDEAPDGPANAANLLIVSAGVLVHMATIGSLGFIVASTLLFAACARGFGSRRSVRDLAIGAVLAFVTWLVFSPGLGINLPVGPLPLPAP
jgi:putative tricarboxylic transport membrane protein